MSNDLADRVSALPFFAGLAPRLLDDLCAAGRPVTYNPGERLFAEGGEADQFWLIESGTVALDLRVPGRGDHVIETLTAGTVAGWSWLYPPYRWNFGATARTPLRAVVFDAVAVRGRCDADPAFGYAMLRLFTPVIAERLQATRLRLLDLYATPAQAGKP
ncbi:cyclic nucleotide-binding domain-containing protein [Paractinoplanes hotanensis]|uniref:Cyclic nucleotide-binding domain-containing protein n=1 Tax=Paractinoplanes hotanensis TaxID=2906497 RepID=A0ABT0Y5Y6_9ACTN|nr:cyclic nucleotide-binding domain-containing protein [Actinoplanes hotanensis]MCM4081245.1 cyclic nucleotide-binding domain-containing protein [Actinoplanes hotanensis]